MIGELKDADAFPNLNLCQITPTSEPEEDEEEDGENEGEDPTQVAGGDNTGEEVVKIPDLEVPEVATTLARVSLAMMLQEAATAAEPVE